MTTPKRSRSNVSYWIGAIFWVSVSAAYVPYHHSHPHDWFITILMGVAFFYCLAALINLGRHEFGKSLQEPDEDDHNHWRGPYA
jgi:hypothetical protein